MVGGAQCSGVIVDKGSELYQISLLPLCGVEVRGIDLKQDIDPTVVDRIKADVHRYRIMVFRDQGVISGERQVEISRWFGELDSQTFYKHPRSPHFDVFRVSNDNTEGCTGVGRTGWHIDGSFRECPYSHSIYHIIAVPKEGDTAFTPLTEVVQSLSPTQKSRWERLHMVSDRKGSYAHPLVYNHPITGKETLCFHLGMTESFVWDYGGPQARSTDWQETTELLTEIHRQIIRDNRAFIYSHKLGDFIISDNLAVGHEASPQTQLPRQQVGLRVMHRTTVRGKHTPVKSH